MQEWHLYWLLERGSQMVVVADGMVLRPSASMCNPLRMAGCFNLSLVVTLYDACRVTHQYCDQQHTSPIRLIHSWRVGMMHECTSSRLASFVRCIYSSQREEHTTLSSKGKTSTKCSVYIYIERLREFFHSSYITSIRCILWVGQRFRYIDASSDSDWLLWN